MGIPEVADASQSEGHKANQFRDRDTGPFLSITSDIDETNGSLSPVKASRSRVEWIAANSARFYSLHGNMWNFFMRRAM